VTNVVLRFFAFFLRQFLITFNIPFSAFIMVAIAVDRYLCICRPFLRCLTVRRAKIIICLLGLCAGAIGVCVALMHGIFRRLPQQSSLSVVLDYESQSADVEGVPPELPSSLLESSPDVTWSAGDFLTPQPIDAEHRGNQSLSREMAPAAVEFADQTVEANDSEQSNEFDGVFYVGVCHANSMLLSVEFAQYFRKFYNGLFVVCLVTIVVLYTMIYRSVLALRERRRRRKSGPSKCPMPSGTPAVAAVFPPPAAAAEPSLRSLSPMDVVADEGRSQQPENGTENGNDRTAADVKPTPADGADDAAKNENETPPAVVERRQRMLPWRNWRLKPRQKSSGNAVAELAGTGKSNGCREMTLRERYRQANLKTAAMLFVVTVIFVVTFLPAFLMNDLLVPYRLFIFYLYFVNNVANPFIYSFMNRNFRDAMCSLFCSRRRATARSATTGAGPVGNGDASAAGRTDRHRARSRDIGLHRM
jgi:hypothetical protein